MHFSTLLIEPPGIDSQLLQVMLAPEKFRVETVECGHDAWNLIVQRDPPDLVVIDADLQFTGNIRIGAAQLLKLMNSRANWKSVPKIVLTSDQKRSLIKLSSDTGIEAVILKPFDPRRFVQEIYNSMSKLLDRHIEEINRQHLNLGTLFHDAIHQAHLHAHELLGNITKSIEAHFAFEERFMMDHSYPDFLPHYGNHQHLLAKTKELMHGLKAGPASLRREKIEQLRRDLFDDVNDDRKYIQFLNDLRLSLIGSRAETG